MYKICPQKGGVVRPPPPDPPPFPTPLEKKKLSDIEMYTYKL